MWQFYSDRCWPVFHYCRIIEQCGPIYTRHRIYIVVLLSIDWFTIRTYCTDMHMRTILSIDCLVYRTYCADVYCTEVCYSDNGSNNTVGEVAILLIKL